LFAAGVNRQPSQYRLVDYSVTRAIAGLTKPAPL
jgi:hypothetical protein